MFSIVGAPRSEQAAVVSEALAASAPGLVVNTGDVSSDGVTLEDDLAEARRLHETFGLPVGAIPGNHDVGEAHDVPGSKEVPISAERRERYLRYFAIDAMLLASELGVAAGQLDFLARAVGSSNDCCGYACSFVRVPGLQRLDIADFAAAFGKAV